MEFTLRENNSIDGITSEDLLKNDEAVTELISNTTQKILELAGEKAKIEEELKLHQSTLKDFMLERNIEGVKTNDVDFKIKRTEKFTCRKKSEFAAELNKAGLSQFVKINVEPDMDTIKSACNIDEKLNELFGKYVSRSESKSLAVNIPKK